MSDQRIRRDEIWKRAVVDGYKQLVLRDGNSSLALVQAVADVKTLLSLSDGKAPTISEAWRPIEAAPRDETFVVVARIADTEPNKGAVLWWYRAAFWRGAWHTAYDYSARLKAKPTHFFSPEHLTALESLPSTPVGKQRCVNVDELVFELRQAAIMRHVMDQQHTSDWANCDYPSCAKVKTMLEEYDNANASTACFVTAEEAERTSANSGNGICKKCGGTMPTCCKCEFSVGKEAGEQRDANELVKTWIAQSPQSNVTDEDAEDLALRVIAYGSSRQPSPVGHEQQAREIVGDLLRYVDHLRGCTSYTNGPCSCGLQSVLETVGRTT